MSLKIQAHHVHKRLDWQIFSRRKPKPKNKGNILFLNLVSVKLASDHLTHSTIEEKKVLRGSKKKRKEKSPRPLTTTTKVQGGCLLVMFSTFEC